MKKVYKKDKVVNKNDDDMQDEYSFKNGIRGKHYEAYRKGHIVKIYKDDGKVSINHFALEDGAVMLDPDIKKYFPDSKSVNNALRTILKILPVKRRR